MTAPTYANRPRTWEDDCKTAQIIAVTVLPAARASYRRGLEKGAQLAAQAAQRVRWTITVKACDAGAFGLAVGLLLGVIADHLVSK
jgi:arginase family enzyme